MNRKNIDMWWPRLAFSANVLVTGLLFGQAPAGYHLGAAVSVPDSLVEVLAGGRFRATVIRTAHTSRERELIETAEQLYPDSEVMFGISRDATYRERLATTASGISPATSNATPRPAGNPRDRWWHDDFDSIWTPFAVTGGAVDYYLGHLRDLAAGRGRFKYARGQEADHGTFEYHATVRSSTQSGVADIVELRITWSYWCGTMCAMYFTHTRTVSFDRTGAVVRVRGDGVPEVIVS